MRCGHPCGWTLFTESQRTMNAVHAQLMYKMKMFAENYPGINREHFTYDSNINQNVSLFVEEVCCRWYYTTEMLNRLTRQVACLYLPNTLLMCMSFKLCKKNHSWWCWPYFTLKQCATRGGVSWSWNPGGCCNCTCHSLTYQQEAYSVTFSLKCHPSSNAVWAQTRLTYMWLRDETGNQWGRLLVCISAFKCSKSVCEFTVKRSLNHTLIPKPLPAALLSSLRCGRDL